MLRGFTSLDIDRKTHAISSAQLPLVPLNIGEGMVVCIGEEKLLAKSELWGKISVTVTFN